MSNVAYLSEIILVSFPTEISGILSFATYISFLCHLNAICAIDKKLSYRATRCLSKFMLSFTSYGSYKGFKQQK